MRQVLAILRTAGFSVWTDAGLEPGTQSWQDAIAAALDQVQAVVVLLSPHASQSDWVKNEISFAKRRKKRILPVLIAGDDESAVPISLINFQWIDGRASLEQAVTQSLLPALRRHTPLAEPVAPAPPDPSPQPVEKQTGPAQVAKADAPPGPTIVAPASSLPPGGATKVVPGAGDPQAVQPDPAPAPAPEAPGSPRKEARSRRIHWFRSGSERLLLRYWFLLSCSFRIGCCPPQGCCPLPRRQRQRLSCCRPPRRKRSAPQLSQAHRIRLQRQRSLRLTARRLPPLRHRSSAGMKPSTTSHRSSCGTIAHTQTVRRSDTNGGRELTMFSTGAGKIRTWLNILPNREFYNGIIAVEATPVTDASFTGYSLYFDYTALTDWFGFKVYPGGQCQFLQLSPPQDAAEKLRHPVRRSMPVRAQNKVSCSGWSSAYKTKK